MPLRTHRLVVALSVFLLCASVRADEIHLKDGSKITGTIVGYEDGQFKVQTSYGFALIRKDSISEIIPSAGRKDAPSTAPDANRAATSSRGATGEFERAERDAPEKPVAPPPVSAPVAPSGSNELHASGTAIASEKRSSAASPVSTPAPRKTPLPISSSPEIPPNAAGNASEALEHRALAGELAVPDTDLAFASAFSPEASPAFTPAVPVLPIPAQPIRAFVQGNLYINQTYHFEMYRPPDWDLVGDADKALPNAIGALGTNDHNSLLVISRETLDDSLEARAAAAERFLSGICSDYKLLSSRRTSIGELPAIEQRARGTLGEHSWSIILVTLAHGDEALTFLGMTYANSDLIQIQENVISRAIASVHFAGQ